MLSPPGLFFPSSNPFSLFSSRAQSYLRTYRCLHAHLRLHSYPSLHAHLRLHSYPSLHAYLRLHAHQKKDHDTVQAVDGSRAFTAVPAVPHSGSDAHVSSQQVLSPEIKKKWHIDLYKLDHYGQIRNFQFLYRRFLGVFYGRNQENRIPDRSGKGFSTVRIKKTGFLTVVERGFLR